ncbi:Hsp33 family molecular chaperone HslO [Periweissella cryptocerci]|uniref:33 kDa chaperonin n=1 Tax=Periweissella cryptocerci TaxID=2506420 RepID=A0A4P6YT94_9LACO|nr:Hsp33 family molecular chaperone HslO [Periweissella cryptocerci]QBO35867.1 Hsp33 family molecular chaperone HslO [Periweissella cryptocerci]
MEDYLIKSVTEDGNFRAYAVTTTNLVAEAQKRHDTWASASAALGRTLTGTLLLASSVLKGDDEMTVKIDGGGPVGGIVVDGTANGIVKGYIQNPHVNLEPKSVGHIDVAAAVGTDGFITVTKDQGFGDPFTGQVPLSSGEIGDDFTYYLAKSEQIPSAVGVSVFVNPDFTIGAAGGFLVQLLPGAEDDAISALEKKLGEMPLLSKMLLDGHTPESILEFLFGEGQVNFIDKVPVKFECDCSKEKFAERMASLPASDLQEIIDEDHGAQVVCQFCENKYEYSEADLKQILANQK